MKESPRRPLILKRRKLPFQRRDPNIVHPSEHNGPQAHATKPILGGQPFPEAVRILDHPCMPDTQVVIIPKSANLQSVIGALSNKGKECGPEGRTKFILLSSSSSQDATEAIGRPPSAHRGDSHGNCLGSAQSGKADGPVETKALTAIKPQKKQLESSPLNDSLTNMQWLGKLSSEGGPAEATVKFVDKENQPPKESEGLGCMSKGSLSERPPYSYMAMIQFAINSKQNKQMTLKEIYTWIEDHFPYFRNVAKPGWKNSIRHNLSLHDMFIRESTPDGKVSYWTIRPEANRCLTLDQVYKPGTEPALSPSQPTHVCEKKHQKRVVPEVKRTASSVGSERKMKPLLPRTDSYLVPIQLPASSSLFLPVAPPQPPCSSQGGGKRVRIIPKSTQATLPPSASCRAGSTPTASHPRRESSSSRRKQCLVSPSSEEPVLLFPEPSSTFFDSGVASDLSVLQDTRDVDPEPQMGGVECTFKTPVKGAHPTSSSTPSRPSASHQEAPRTEGHTLPDLSPIRTPLGSTLTPQRHDHTPFSFSDTPFKELFLFNSPRDLLTTPRGSPASRELLAGNAGNRSLTEGLLLDPMNDSLSKILVDISFSGLEDEELNMGNISWSQLIPDLK